MTEAVILALIALFGSLIFATTIVTLVGLVLKSEPSSFKFIWTEYGQFEVRFNKEADE